MDALIGSSQSLEVVQKQDTNPPIRVGWITDAVTHIMISKMTCEEYLQMTNEWYSTHQRAQSSWRECSIDKGISKRAEYRIPSSAI